jgi:hypothetical protein
MAEQGHRSADALEFQARRVNGAKTTLTLFGWRRAAQRRDHEIEASAFAPVVLDAQNCVSLLDVDGKTPTIEARPHSIELDVEGSSVWIWRGADPAMVTMIIGALKAAK